MNIFQFSDNLQSRLKDKLYDLNADQDELLKLGSALTFIRDIIGELKEFVSKYRFGGQAEEIKFFKEVKPVFLSQYFYYKKLFALRLYDSFKDQKTRFVNYYKTLDKLEQFAHKHESFYRYCLMGATDMDTMYFTRNSGNLKSLEADGRFTTGFDRRLTKILCNELLKKYILSVLQKSQSDPGSPSALTWTASKTDLTELIYALQAAEVFNNGSADIKQIATSFESLCNINLGDYYRTFQSIQVRKSGQTLFLNQLSKALNKKLEEN